MDAAPLDALCAALDAEVVQLRDLVDVCQREQAHVIAFETAELTACVEAKLTLTREVEAHERVCRAADGRGGRRGG
jgi:flagellar biosynthesis/type III secretory pathway chaperone